MIKRISFILLILTTVLISCNESGGVEVKDTGEMHHATEAEIEQLIEDFIMVEEGGTIDIPAGFYEIESQLILDNVNKVTIQGAGMDHTILSFKKLLTGGEGMKIVGNDVVLQDFSVYDAPGDGIKTQHCDGLTFRRINATWTNGDKSKNGTYAIYPVQCNRVMIDGCIASHSRDAGIYVGQSDNIIVKNCIAFGNVAGIEIENCNNAQVFDNEAYDNTGGILVFNLPGLLHADGKNTKIFNNKVYSNNHTNFAQIEGNSGNAVTMIPPGSGIIVLAAKGVEIYNNEILKNKTVGVAVASYQITGFDAEHEGWSPFSYDIYVHDNTFERTAALPDMTKELGQLITAKNAYGIAKTQDLIYDGILDPSKGTDISKNPMNICIQEPAISDLHFTYFELSENIDDIKGFKEYSYFDCAMDIAIEASNVSEL